MEWINALRLRIKSLLHRRRLDRDLQDELAFHLSMREEKFRLGGASATEAKEASRRRFGNELSLAEACRKIWTFYPLEIFWQDVRYALRSLNRQRSFTWLAVLTLSLGIGATTVGFGVVENLLFDPYPYKGADRLTTMVVHGPKDPDNQGRSWFSPPDFLHYQKENHVFEDMIGSYDELVVYTGPGSAQEFPGAVVTANTFEFFGVPPLLGRGITAEDARPGAQPVFVMNYKLWKEMFAGDPKILGRSFTLNGQPRTLVGIMPPGFQAYGVRVWRPLTASESETDDSGQAGPRIGLWLIGRLKPGTSLQTAAADLNVVARGLAKIHPREYPASGFTILTMTVNDFVMGDFKTMLYTLMAAVLMLLLIACSNTANLLLARATTRDREMAIRAAIGASRSRLVLQLLVEASAVAVAGGLAGCLLAYFGLKVVVLTIPLGPLPEEAVIGLNPVVLLLTVGVVVVTTFLCGLAPALHASRNDLRERLGTAGGDDALRHKKFRASLVMAEVALSLLLLVGAGLMIRNFARVLRADLGFDSRSLVYARLVPAAGFLDSPQQQRIFFAKAMERIKALPGVTAVAETTNLAPFGGVRMPIVVRGSEPDPDGRAMLNFCSEDYFKAMGLQPVRGDLLTAADVDSARPVLVVNQAFARQYLGNKDPIGQEVSFPMFDRLPDTPRHAYFRILGVISDFRNQGLQEPTVPELFLPYTISGIGPRSIVVRTAASSDSLLPGIREAIWATDPRVAFGTIGSVQDLLDHFIYRDSRFGVISLGAFAGIGLTLVIMGVFSVMMYAVSLQRREFGIRLALGAQRTDLLGMVLLKGFRLIAAGIAVGFVGSFGFVRFLEHQIHGVPPSDPLTLGAAVIILLGAGLVACILPAQQATRTNPVAVIRHE